MIESGIITGIVMAVAEWLKSTGINKKCIPIANMICGIILCFAGTALGVLDTNAGMAVFQGMAIGLTASGLYSSGKNIGQYLNQEGDDKNGEH